MYFFLKTSTIKNKENTSILKYTSFQLLTYSLIVGELQIRNSFQSGHHSKGTNAS